MKRRLIEYNAPVTLSFVFLSLAALLLGYLTGGASTRLLFSVYRCSLLDLLGYPRLLLHVLGHASFAHFSGNITLLLVLGPGLEERYGSRVILFAVLVTAFISGLAQWLLFPGVALLGASGIVFMMILMSSLGGSRGGGVPLTLILVFLIYVGGEVVKGISAQDNVSQLTHVIGGVCGTVLGVGLRKNA